jgi:hypothetical protein
MLQRAHDNFIWRNTMQFMLIFKETDGDVAQKTDPQASPAYWGAWNAYVGALGQAGVIVSGNGLQEPHTATHVQMRGGRRVIHDGPYADTKEHLGGYFIIEVPGLDEALTWAARSPNAVTGTTEVRPVLPPPVAR